jgi:hypothetical protein
MRVSVYNKQWDGLGALSPTIPWFFFVFAIKGYGYDNAGQAGFA